MKIIQVKDNDVNLRLDNFLAKMFPSLSKPFIFKSIRTNKVKVNGKKVKFDYRLKLNDEIKLFINDLNDSKRVNKNLYTLARNILDVIYEDENLLVVNKPAKLLVNDEDEQIPDTLINRAKKYLFNNKKWNPQLENQFEPCLIHRIDFNTMGLVMIAKTHIASVILSEKIKNREISKFYLCLVHGKMLKQNELLEAYWSKSSKENLVRISNTSMEGSKYIATKYKVLNYDSKKDISLLEIELLTGRTHQIRAHMSFIGHPLVGEQKYTNKFVNKNYFFKSQALIAYKLIFNFTSDAQELNYLNKKTIELPRSKINF